MAQNIKFGDMDVQIPSFDFNKFGRFIPIIIILLLATFSFYTVDANENGVVLRLGKYSHTTLPGLRFKIPLIDRVYRVQVDKQFKREFGFRTLKAGVQTQYSKRNYYQESWMLTGDLNIADVRWIIQFKIKSAADYLFNVRDVENTIRDVSEAALRLMIGDRSFTEVVQTDRVAIADTVFLYPRFGYRRFDAPWDNEDDLPVTGRFKLVLDTDAEIFDIFTLGAGVSWTTEEGKVRQVDLAGDFGGDSYNVAMGYTHEF